MTIVWDFLRKCEAFSPSSLSTKVFPNGVRNPFKRGAIIQYSKVVIGAGGRISNRLFNSCGLDRKVGNSKKLKFLRLSVNVESNISNLRF